LIEFFIDRAALEQFIAGARGHNLALIHDEDGVAVFNREDPLSNDEFRDVLVFRLKRLANEGIGVGVARAGGIIKNQDLSGSSKEPEQYKSVAFDRRKR
jgi:hypothetical protein